MSTGVETRQPSRAGQPRPDRSTTGATRIRLARLDMKVSPYAYIAPFFVIFAIFGLYPIGYTFWVSLHNWAPGSIDHPFIGAANYTELWADPQFWNTVRNTVGIFVLSTVPQLTLALVLANTLNRRLRYRTFFRMAIAVPIITSTAAVAIVFGQLYGRDFGLFNYLLQFVGVHHHIDWHSSKWASWTAISTMVDWRWTGYNALIYLAAMQSISKDLYESAELDGASRRRQFWQITVPLLRPTIIFTVIISTIGGMQLFTEPLMFGTGSGALSGGNEGEYQTVTMYIIQTMFERFRFGYASAIAWMLFLLIIVITFINYLITRRINSAES